MIERKVNLYLILGGHLLDSGDYLFLIIPAGLAHRFPEILDFNSKEITFRVSKNIKAVKES